MSVTEVQFVLGFRNLRFVAVFLMSSDNHFIVTSSYTVRDGEEFRVEPEFYCIFGKVQVRVVRVHYLVFDVKGALIILMLVNCITNLCVFSVGGSCKTS